MVLSKKKFVLLSILTLVLGFLVVGNVNAVSYNEEDGKALAEGVIRCYNDGYMTQSVSLSSLNSLNDIIGASGENFVPLPNGHSSLHTIKDNGLSCEQLFNGYSGLIGGKFSGLLRDAGFSTGFSSLENKKQVLRALGYTSEGTEEGKVITFNLKKGNKTVPASDQLVSTNGTMDTLRVDKVVGSYIAMTINGDVLRVTLSGEEYELTISDYESIDSLKKAIDGLVLKRYKQCITVGSAMGSKGMELCYASNNPFNEDSLENANDGVWTLKGDIAAIATNVAGTLTGQRDPVFSKGQKFNLYSGYLLNYYGVEPICDYDNEKKAQLIGEGYRLGGFYVGNEIKPCYGIAKKEHFEDKVNGLSAGNVFDGTQKTWEELMTETRELAGDEEVKEDAEEGEIDEVPDEEEDVCYDAGVDGVSWIVCPMINNLTDSADEMDKTINALLYINKDDYGYGSKVEGFWKEMVKIANVAVIIVLLVIIVSQITGFGIDNYGIKKMLPKLLIMAVLINFSFVICVIAVDLSNIFGEGLNQLFSGIGSSITGGEQNNLTGLIGTLVTLAFATAGVGSLISPLGVMTVFVVLLALISVVFGFLLFFFSLGARMMLVILCIGISPLAFACYILPNTQGLFKKWWDIFKAALLLFPICGALSGISVIIREIGSSSDNVMMMVISMISVVIPYYALPVLLKNALSALPAIGNAITGFSGAVRKGVSNASTYVKNSEAYKEAQNESARSQQYANAQRTIERINGRMRGNDPSSLSMVDQRRLARASEIVKKHGEVDDAARIALAERQFEGLSQAQVEQAWTTAVQNGDADQVRALTSVMDSNYGSTAAGFIGRYLSGVQFFDGNQFRNEQMQRSFGALQDVLRNNRSFSANMKNKSSDAFQMISSGGYTGERDATTNELIRDNNGNLLRANMDFHSAHNNVMTENKDFATQSADTLRRAAVNGGPLTQERATELLNSEDPSIRNGIASDAGKRRVLEAVAGGYTGDFGDNLAVDNAVNTYRTRVNNQVNAEDSQRQQVLTDIHDIAEQARRSNNP